MTGGGKLIDAAVALAERGWFVFPVRGKDPATQHGFQDALTGADNVRALFRRSGTTGIGIECGRSRLLVVDIDGPRGEEAWTRLLLRHGIVETLEAASGRPDGGRHLYLETRDDRSSNTAGRLGTNLDTRGKGGYVVAPPSLHPSGRSYRWVNHRPLARAPEWLLEALAPATTPPAVSGERRPLPPGTRVTAYGRAALEGLADDLLHAVEGTRNETLRRCSCRAGRLEAAGELHAETAELVLLAAAQSVGLPATEARKTFASAFGFGQRYPAMRRAS